MVTAVATIVIIVEILLLQTIPLTTQVTEAVAITAVIAYGL